MIIEKLSNNTVLEMSTAEALEMISLLSLAVASVNKFDMQHSEQMTASERTDKVSTGYAPSALTLVVLSAADLKRKK